MTPKPTAKAILSDSYANMEAVFDALDAYIAGTTWITCNATVNLDGSGTTHTMTCQDRLQNSFTYSERDAGIRVSIQPVSATLGPGQTQQFVATATNPDGTPVSGAAFTWTLSQSSLGSVDATGLYTAPASITQSTMVQVNAALTTGQSWASVTVALQP